MLTEYKGKHKIKVQYWLFIENHVHISLKTRGLLLYNSLTGQCLEYPSHRFPAIMRMGKRLLKPKNLRIVRLRQKDLDDTAVSLFVRDVRESFMGDLLDVSLSDIKPVQLIPIPTVQKEAGRLKKDELRSVGEDMMACLNEISIYLNNRCEQRCHMCARAYRQFSCCTVSRREKERELDITHIQAMLAAAGGSSLSRINLLGGDLFQYSGFKELTEMLNGHSAEKVYHSHYKNVVRREEQLKRINPRSSRLRILVNSSIDQAALKVATEGVGRTGLDCMYIFIVQDEAQFERSEATVLSLGIDRYQFQPFYNGSNLDFFKRNVFFSKEEVLQSRPSMKDIYQNSLVNRLNFGKLTVLIDGGIYANVNRPWLGVLGKHSLYDVLYIEMEKGGSWCRTRRKTQPCRSCTFEALCPPLTNYSHAIGRNNLCTHS
jgi:pseudo-rSAM protein